MMSDKEFIGTLALIDRYKAMMAKHYVIPVQSEGGIGIQHAGWMLEELEKKIHSGDPAFDDGKCGRWIGFIQHALAVAGFTTVKEERDFSRPYFRKV